MPFLAHLTICSLDFRYAGQLAQTQESASPVNVGGIKAGSFHWQANLSSPVNIHASIPQDADWKPLSR
jgi:hypothetical protein